MVDHEDLDEPDAGAPSPVPQPDVLSPWVAKVDRLAGEAHAACPNCRQHHRGTYPKQCEVAQRVQSKMLEHLSGSSFDDFQVFMLVPNLSSLYRQTLERLQPFIEEMRDAHDPAFLLGAQARNVVFKANLGVANKDVHAEMCRLIKSQPRTLFLLIHDEAHYEATRGTEDKPAAVHTFINHKDVTESPNVVTLLVSATPYNLVSAQSRIPEHNIVPWMASEGEGDDSAYYGLKKYAERTKQRAGLQSAQIKRLPALQSGYIAGDYNFENKVDQAFERIKKSFVKTVKDRSLPFKKLDKRDCDGPRCKLLIDDYIAAMGAIPDDLAAAQPESENWVERIDRAMGQKTNEALGAPQRKQILRRLSQEIKDAEHKPSPETQLVVNDLLRSAQGSERGCMVLVRVTERVFGIELRLKLQEARDARQLKFAVILDADETRCGSLDALLQPEEWAALKARRDQVAQSNPQWYEQRYKKVVWPPQLYTDLLDVPCILILCERGKMGDTFPRSLRHYDLRMRYANTCEVRQSVEQDLGRAFRYHSEGDPDPLPIILVGKSCAQQLSGRNTRGGEKVQLLALKPDSEQKIGPMVRGKPVYPQIVSADLAVYRRNWQIRGQSKKSCAAGEEEDEAGEVENGDPQGHYDSWPHSEHNNRFLLVGLPQIGKTGAFLHVIWLLWEKFGRKIEDIGEEVPPPEPGPRPPDPPEQPTPLNMEAYPNFDDMQSGAFRDEPGCGKYGDPRDPRLQKHYLDPGYSKDVHESAKDTTTAASGSNSSAEGAGTGAAAAAVAPSAAATSALAVAPAVPPPKDKAFFTHRRSQETTATREYDVFEKVAIDIPGLEERQFGKLHIEKDQRAAWWTMGPDDSLPKLKAVDGKDLSKQISFPIFVVSSGRARCTKCSGARASGECSCALLDLSVAFQSSGLLVSGSKGGIGYVQILVVKPKELDDYKRFNCPAGAAIFELPPAADADDVGVGFSRFCAKVLAERIHSEPHPFCFVLDDSVHYWKGITLPDDPKNLFGVSAPKEQAQKTDLSLADVLLHFQTDRSRCMENFGAIGFHRLNGYDTSKAAYDWTHCYSAVLLNLKLLGREQYPWRAHCWEDIQFNRDVAQNNGSKALMCKCYRFAFAKKQLHEGGCSDIVARPDPPLPEPAPAAVADEEAPAPAPAPALAPDLPNKPMVDFTKFEVVAWMRGAFVENANFMQKIDQFATEMVNGGMDGQSMCDAEVDDFEVGFSFNPMQRRQLVGKWKRANDAQSVGTQEAE